VSRASASGRAQRVDAEQAARQRGRPGKNKQLEHRRDRRRYARAPEMREFQAGADAQEAERQRGAREHIQGVVGDCRQADPERIAAEAEHAG
jgi:hypothetical protein